MNRSDALEVLDAVENGMIKLGQSRDIWQNDLVYTALQGVRLLLLDAIKKRSETPKEGDQTCVMQCKECAHYHGFAGQPIGGCAYLELMTHEGDYCMLGRQEEGKNGK